MHIDVDEVTADISNDPRAVQSQPEEREQPSSESQTEDEMRRFLRKLDERSARVCVD